MPRTLIAPRRNNVSVQLLTQFGIDHGMLAGECLAGTGLDWQTLGTPGAEVDAEQELLLIRNLVRHLGHIPGIGIQAGYRYRLSTYGVYGFAMLSCPTFRSALSIAARYLDLTYLFQPLLADFRDDGLHIVANDQDIPDDLRDFIIGRDYAAIAQLERDLLLTPLEVLRAELRTPCPAAPRPYQELFGVMPLFGARENRVIKDNSRLDLPRSGDNPEAVRACEEQCRALLANRRARNGLSGAIRGRMLAHPGRLPDMEQVANALHMTPRTLRRRLNDEGVTFRQLQDELRQALAEELLATGSLTLEEIAERLGYADVSNFSHAFKRWSGVSPGRYRPR